MVHLRPHLLPLLRHLALGGAALSLVACTTVNPSGPRIEAFHTDGCSLFPDRSLVSSTDWCHCCVAHDLRYWRGGTAADREAADQALRQCVRQATGSISLADTMYTGVRAGGSPYLFTPFRWAYGWPFGRHYTPLTADETAQADAEQARYLAANPTLACPAPEPESAHGHRPTTH